MLQTFRRTVCISILFILSIPMFASNQSVTVDDLTTSLLNASQDEIQGLLSEHQDSINLSLWKVIWDKGEEERKHSNYLQAFKILNVATLIAEKIGDKKAVADSLLSKGIAQRWLGEYSDAMNSLEKCLPMFLSLNDKIGVGDTWLNIGVIHFRLGNYDQAMEFYQKSLALDEEIGYNAGIAKNLAVIGDYYYWQSNYAMALQFWKKGLSLRRTIGDKNGIASTLNDIAAIYYSQGNYTLAKETYKEVWKLYEEFGSKHGVAVAMQNLGETCYRMGNYDEAMSYLKRCLALRQILEDKPSMPSTLQTIADVYFEQGSPDLALESLNHCLTLSLELGDKAFSAIVMFDIARVHYQLKNYEAALDFAERAIQIANPLQNLETLWNSQALQGKAYLELNQDAKAQLAFESAIGTIENLRTKVVGSEQEQQVFFESKVAPYVFLSTLLIKEGKIEEAFANSERAKARVLLDVLHSGKFQIEKSMTPEEQQQETEWKHQLSLLSLALQKEKDSSQQAQDKIEQLNSNLEKTRLDYEAFRTNLYAEHPQLQTHRGEAKPVSAKEAVALLQDDKTAILEYLITEKKTYLFVITKNTANDAGYSIKNYEIAVSQKKLSNKIENFRQQISERSIGFGISARELYDLLLNPALPQLKGKNAVIIIPDQTLWELPFQCLRSPQKRYAIEDLTISYAPSLTVFREMFQSRQKKNFGTGPDALFAIANPEIAKGTATLVRESMQTNTLEPLPETEKEVNALSKLYGANKSKVYVRKEASEENVKIESSNFDILHFASHGIFDNTSPLHSNIVLSRSENSAEDGLLEAWEIMQMNLKSRLVVLSACETARGRVGAGEGIIGLTWAFFVAGTPSTVVSQWKVESTSTAQLMLEFHRNLEERKMPSAVALQNAELSLLRESEYRHPFYWASFVIIGDGS